METNMNIEERLWSYIDGSSAPEERSVVEKLLQENSVWKAKYKELLDINQLLHSSELDQPSLRFTKNVMEEITRLHIAPAAKIYINKRIIWGIAIFFIVLIIGFLGYGFGQIDWSATSGSSVNMPVDLNKVDYSKFFNNTYLNIFMMVNVVLGLFLLDRYLASKRKKFREEA